MHCLRNSGTAANLLPVPRLRIKAAPPKGFEALSAERLESARVSTFSSTLPGSAACCGAVSASIDSCSCHGQHAQICPYPTWRPEPIPDACGSRKKRASEPAEHSSLDSGSCGTPVASFFHSSRLVRPVEQLRLEGRQLWDLLDVFLPSKKISPSAI